MAFQVVPVPRVIDPVTGNNSGAVEFGVTLESKPVRFVFQWNRRGSMWEMSVFDGNAVPLVEGVAVMSGYPLLRAYQNDALPPGALFVVDTQGTDAVPDLNGFGGANEGGGRWQLVYMPLADIEALAT